MTPSNTNILYNEEEGKVFACPDCDSAGNVHLRRGNNTHAGNPDHDCLCGACGETFDRDDVVERDDRRVGNGQPKYADLSPEDVGLESDGDPP